MDASPQEPARRRVTEHLRKLRFDAGTLCLDLVATVGRRGCVPVERMGDPGRLDEWCQGVGISLAEGYDPAVTLQALHELREAAFDIASSVIDGHRPRPEALVLVNRLARPHPPTPRLEWTPEGVRSSGREQLTVQQLMSTIARDLIDLMSDSECRSRMHACASEACRMIYLDTPGGRTRKWCSMQRCGNQAKAASHRRRTTRAVGPPADLQAVEPSPC
ncbi:CGNR zinc finger domain-containing protein [Streptomyces nigra]|uniref:CGNR zinc finger domain-containing protein n=1 Tax=Streptomyces nigra TaxID=1827580 RepID=UPI0036C13DCA